MLNLILNFMIIDMELCFIRQNCFNSHSVILIGKMKRSDSIIIIIIDYNYIITSLINN